MQSDWRASQPAKGLLPSRQRSGVAIVDFTPERAELVRRLNREGIPVIASLTMPPEQGFYFNAENALLDSEWMSATRNSPLTLGACHFGVHEKRGY